MSYQFIRFCIVGFTGFLVDFAILHALVTHGTPPIIGRILSIACALQVTFLLHRHFTFRVLHHWGKSWLKFMLANVFGACVNYLVFCLMLRFTGHELAIVISTGVALFVNYASNRKFVFRP